MSKCFGTILVERGEITPEQLAAAQEVFDRDPEPIGRILARQGVMPQERIDRLWLELIVQSALIDAIDRASGNRFSVQADHAVRFTRVVSKQTRVLDMLAAAGHVGDERLIEGEVILTLDGRDSLPIEFVIEGDTGFALLSDVGESVVRRWVPMVERTRNKEAA